MNFRNDPKNYELMSVAFETEEEMKLAFAGFDKALSKLRKKYRIAEILVVKQAYLKDSYMMSMGAYGSELAVLPMAILAVNKAYELNTNLLTKLSEELNKK